MKCFFCVRERNTIGVLFGGKEFFFRQNAHHGTSCKKGFKFPFEGAFLLCRFLQVRKR